MKKKTNFPTEKREKEYTNRVNTFMSDIKSLFKERVTNEQLKR